MKLLSIGGSLPHDTELGPRLIKYLLGELPDLERDKLEDVYLSNAELHDELVAIEDELIYTYVRGGLSPSQRAGFERLFLTTPERKSKVDFARAFTTYLEANSPAPAERGVPNLWTKPLTDYTLCLLQP